MLTTWAFSSMAGIEADAKVESVVCDLRLDPGKTVRGTVLDPDGKPLAGVRILGPLGAITMRDLLSAEFAFQPSIRVSRRRITSGIPRRSSPRPSS